MPRNMGEHIIELEEKNKELKAQLHDSKIVCDVCGVDHLGCLVLCPSCASKGEAELKAKLDRECVIATAAVNEVEDLRAEIKRLKKAVLTIRAEIKRLKKAVLTIRVEIERLKKAVLTIVPLDDKTVGIYGTQTCTIDVKGGVVGGRDEIEKWKEAKR